ncbi:XTP/dITP diphosphatase [Christensenella tenuis]|jgi:XTP/dITP diphosphohydrolase|uniref:dITP/XTP pyrophosphatase n=1 Tax=Christensenella tenuis TaxID=2763033 RepID=A0ABR7EAX9_9FIRM|nr:XTP/dITP diphosphatase [Christensenella tenuis]MBC5646937.1 XTP/dITP diphosphatase [Christensenella tenuis]
MKQLIIATNNQGKVREIKAILGDFYDEIKSLKDAGIAVDVVEDGDSFHANARKKAVEISEMVEGDVLADDSGLCVEALDMAPGIYSARFSGEGATDEKNNAKLLSLVKEQENRRAWFVCALVLANGGKEKLYVEERAEGKIIDEPRGENGFGYDPLFYVEEYGQTFAEIPPEVKNKISHRAKALKKLQEKVQEI